MDAEKGPPSEPPSMSEPDACGGTGPTDTSAARDEATTTVLSKNAQKRLLKTEAFQSKKLAKKEQKKELKKEQREDRREEEARKRVGNGESALFEEGNQSTVPHRGDNNGVPAVPDATLQQSVFRRAPKDYFLSRSENNFRIVIDCSWESYHTQSTLNSLTQQIMFCHGLNRKHSDPAPVYLTGVGPRVTTNLNKVKFNNWAGVTITEQDYTEHPHFAQGDATSDCLVPGPLSSTRHELVYLTSDSDEILDTLSPSCAYIIGGIVDRNMHKGATYKKAVAQNIRTARLPIKENFQLAATHVLTVNHVFHILLNYAKYQDWKQAISEVLPARKQLTLKGDAKITPTVDELITPTVDEQITPSSPIAGL
ncbi:guanine-1-methyltransferase-domain-containing protein [Ochromonadaceae sp. CCMP2298]|nr:guanine-1-methyltransferase-domain-containing protein [Ochromonadaceae sp. CCMP2298]|mmetsp:Transcript_33453/g.73699  ORF Transcript_33453/g.73699 Transcript_33453/m.73699 type:complete len:367 (+) Transcript_33453:60-1160(+)